MISVIIPAYNATATLGRCLSAVLTSDYPDFECLVVDDSSTDGSAVMAEKLGARVLTLVGGPYGPAYGRNQGALAARGDILFFVDADVLVRPDTLRQVAAAFADSPKVAAMFGGYDDHPESTAFVSQYKNLFHHFVHQQGAEEGGTFWSGCGAIRRDVFIRMGGFDAARYPRPSIEDIELGARLRAAGYHIWLNKTVQVKHLKHWTVLGMVKTDVFDRGIPWTRLILREHYLPDDLNLRVSQRLSALLVCGMLGLGLVLWVGPWALDGTWVIMALATVLGVIALNYRFYQFFLRERGFWFTLGVIPFHLLYYVYSVIAFAVGAALFVWDGVRREPARSI